LARALFFGLPVHGHVNPTLPLVRELVRRGDEVIYFATEEFATRIGETGAVYRPYQNGFLPELGAVSRRMDELAWIFMRTTGEILDQELDAYKALRPDYVMTDSVAPWGHWVSQLLNVPVVTSVTTFAFNRRVLRYAVKQGVRPRGGSAFIISKLRHVAKALSLQRRLRRRYGVPGAGIMGAISNRSGLSLVYTSREFQPCAETFGDAYAFVGPLLESRADGSDFPWDRIVHPRIVYVSLGTLFNADASFYRRCMDGLATLDAQVVLSVGRRVALDSLGAAPANMMLRAHVPQLEVLERASGFITHGGMNSVSESLFYGVPTVVIPQMSEQEIVAGRTQELGAGIVLSKPDVTADTLRSSVDRVLADGEFRQRARAIGDSFRAAGGVERAADLVMKTGRRQGARP
jgi:MGT family glycosyltransferase